MTKALSLLLCVVFAGQTRLNVPQRGEADCALAALATLARVNYETVVIKTRGVGLDPATPKIAADIRKIGAALSHEFTEARTFNATDCGIIAVFVNENQSHALALADGYVYDPQKEFPTKFERWNDGRDRIMYFLKAPCR